MDFRAISTQQSLFIAWMAHTQPILGACTLCTTMSLHSFRPNEEFDVLFWTYVDIRYLWSVSFRSLIQLQLTKMMNLLIFCRQIFTFHRLPSFQLIRLPHSAQPQLCTVAVLVFMVFGSFFSLNGSRFKVWNVNLADISLNYCLSNAVKNVNNLIKPEIVSVDCWFPRGRLSNRWHR